MIKRHLTKAVIAIAVSASLFTPNKVEAAYPVLDISSLMETITQNIQDMQNWAEEKAMSMAEMDLQSMLSSLGIDAQNNAMTNMMVREGRRAETIQNIQVMEWSMPDSDACGTLTQKIVEKETESRNKEAKSVESTKAREKNNNFNQTPSAWKSDVKVIVDEVVDKCQSFTAESNVDGDMSNSMCSTGGLLFGDGKDTLTVTESAAVDTMIDILVGPVPTYKESNLLTDGSDEKKERQIREIRDEAYKDIVRTSLLEVASEVKTTGDLPSPFETLKKFDDERYGSEQWLKDIQNVDPENKNAVYGSEITRKIAVMNAFLVHMEIKKYKQALRMEGLQTAMLSLMIQKNG